MAPQSRVGRIVLLVVAFGIVTPFVGIKFLVPTEEMVHDRLLDPVYCQLHVVRIRQLCTYGLPGLRGVTTLGFPGIFVHACLKHRVHDPFLVPVELCQLLTLTHRAEV